MEKIPYTKSIRFEFLRTANEELANMSGLGEAVIHMDSSSGFTRQHIFAEEVAKSIYKEGPLSRVFRSSVFDLLKSKVFVDCVSQSAIHQPNFSLMEGVDLALREEGNLRDIQIDLDGDLHTRYLLIESAGLQFDRGFEQSIDHTKREKLTDVVSIEPYSLGQLMGRYVLNGQLKIKDYFDFGVFN